MKTQIMKTIGSKVRKSSVFVALFCLLSLNIIPASVHAQEGDEPTAAPVEIKYLGNKDGKLYFQVDFENQTEDNFNIAIKDEQGFVFFREQFKDKKFSKKFQIDAAEIADAKITLSVSSAKSKASQVFQINTNTRIVDDLVVTKL